MKKRLRKKKGVGEFTPWHRRHPHLGNDTLKWLKASIHADIESGETTTREMQFAAILERRFIEREIKLGNQRIQGETIVRNALERGAARANYELAVAIQQGCWDEGMAWWCTPEAAAYHSPGGFCDD